MKESERLLAKIRRVNHQGMPPSNLFRVLRQYWPLGHYMLKIFGWRSAYSFWVTKMATATSAPANCNAARREQMVRMTLPRPGRTSPDSGSKE